MVHEKLVNMLECTVGKVLAPHVRYEYGAYGLVAYGRRVEFVEILGRECVARCRHLPPPFPYCSSRIRSSSG